jgi:hypothetical protein
MSFTTPKVSSIAFKIGVIAFVVQDACRKISISSGIVFVLVYTMNNIWYPLPGAVNKPYLLLQKLSGDSRLP